MNVPRQNSCGAIGAVCSEIMEEIEERNSIESADSYFTIVNNCRDRGITFVDDSFPHSIKSLGDWQMPSDYKWLRPHNITTKSDLPWTVFRDPQPSDVKQGWLGNCGIISAIALIAERPEFLWRIIQTNEYNPAGAYLVRLCIDGQWKLTVVDDFFPCYGSGAVMFVKGDKNQLWVPLIEKALAKLLGSYSALSGRSVNQGLMWLTGVPCESVNLETLEGDLDKQDDTWAILLSAREAGFVLGTNCACGSRKIDKEAAKAKGLVTGHGYSILDVRQEGNHRLLRLRNPWGSTVWNGEFSDEWPHWDPELKERLLGYEYQSGSFWMPFTEFIKYFSNADIAKTREHLGWTELRFPILIGESDRCAHFIVEDSVELCITLFRNVSMNRDEKAKMMLVLHRSTEYSGLGEIVSVTPCTEYGVTGTGDIFLEEGEYTVVCHDRFKGSNPINGHLEIHSSRKIFADIVRCTPEMYNDSFYRFA